MRNNDVTQSITANSFKLFNATCSFLLDEQTSYKAYRIFQTEETKYRKLNENSK